MMIRPIAKINLGLNVVARRPDGYHNLETVFYPVPISDALEVFPMDDSFPSTSNCDIKLTNIPIEGDEQHNLVVRAYELLKQDFPALPRIHAHLYKGIPTQAGMGGGSSDCAAMLVLLNQTFKLGLTDKQLIDYAARLGADCPFFVVGQPAYAEGIGERLQPIDFTLRGWQLTVVRPDIPIPTRDAFSRIKPQQPAHNCRDIVLSRPVSEWRQLLVNDFEQSVFALHPDIAAIKQRLYDLGATYAAMSGSGSAVFALSELPLNIDGHFCQPGTYTFQTMLSD